MSAGARPVLEVDGLDVEYRVRGGTLPALHDVSLAIGPGEVLGVVGESGCGKSTLSSALLRLLPPNGRITAGSILLEGDDLLALDDAALRRVRGERIGMIFQDPMTSLNPTFRVSTQMVNAQAAHGIGASDHERRDRAVAMLDRVGIPDARQRIDAYPHAFSGGMRQRIMLATALLLEPGLLICDEATSALDVTLQAQILDLLRELCEERGTAMIVISHDLGVISEIAGRLLVLYAGRVVEEGAVDTVLSAPQHPYTRRLLASVPSRHRRSERLTSIPGRVPSLGALPPGCAFAPRCDLAQDVCEAGEPALAGDAHRVRCLAADPSSDYDHDRAAAPERAAEAEPVPRPAVGDGAPLVRVEGLKVHFTGRRGLADRILGRWPAPVRALEGIDLEVGRGEAVGLVGESGSGKTTLGKALLGFVPLAAGSASLDGQSLADLDAAGWHRLRPRAQMIYQDPYGSLSPRLSVASLVTEPYRIHRAPPEERYDVDELLELVGLSSEQASKFPHQLSGGQARRVGIARALAMRPDFIVADEPTSGLDVSAAASVLNLLQDLRHELSLSCLIITHDLNLVGYVADRIAVMYLGSVVEIGTADEVFNHPRHPYTRGLLAAVPDLAERAGHDDAATVVGEIPSPVNPPSGCRFRTRCPFAEERCAAEAPALTSPDGRQAAACHFWQEIAAGTKAATGPLPHRAEHQSTPAGSPPS